MINIGSKWTHRNNEYQYEVIAVSSIKLGGTWLEELLVTYQSLDGDKYSRLESDFICSFLNEVKE